MLWHATITRTLFACQHGVDGGSPRDAAAPTMSHRIAEEASVPW